MRTTAAAAMAALLFFLLGNFGVLASAPLFTQYFYDPRLVAIVHVFTLGWMSLMIVGVLRQLAPSAFGVTFRYPRLIGLAAALWIPGVAVMVLGFWGGWPPIAAAGTVLVFSAVLFFLFPTVHALLKTKLEFPHVHVLSSLSYLGLAALLGVWMGVAKGFDITLPAPFHSTLLAHLHLAGAGWAALMIIGVMSRLFPQAYLRRPVEARLRFFCFNLWLIGLTAGLLLGGEWFRPFGQLLGLAVVWYAAAFIPVLWRFRGSRERSTFFLIAAWVVFLLTGLLGMWLARGSHSATRLGMRLQFVYGFVYLFGWVTVMILGMIYRILPTHLSKFLASRGRQATSRLRSRLENVHLQEAVLTLLLVGLALSSAAIVRESTGWFRLGWAIWIVGIGGFLVEVFQLLVALRQALR